jgi:hypothetical protein
MGIISTLSKDASVSDSLAVPPGTHFNSQGTNMASPITASAVALLLQEDLTRDAARSSRYYRAAPQVTATQGNT